MQNFTLVFAYLLALVIGSFCVSLKYELVLYFFCFALFLSYSGHIREYHFNMHAKN